MVPYTENQPPKAFTVGLRPDTSWNHVFVALEWHGLRWESDRSDAAERLRRNFTEAQYQLPSPDDDDDMRIHYWI